MKSKKNMKVNQLKNRLDEFESKSKMVLAIEQYMKAEALKK